MKRKKQKGFPVEGECLVDGVYWCLCQYCGITVISNPASDFSTICVDCALMDVQDIYRKGMVKEHLLENAWTVID